jgi:uncharacterized protein
MGSTRSQATRVTVRKSPLGKALFAKVAFKADEEIGQVGGKLIFDAEYGSEYCVALDEQICLEPSAPFRYLNHSCEPNCQLLTWEDEETTERKLGVFALVDIPAGVELTIDYAWSADAAIKCLCGTPSCRGWVVAQSELAGVKRPRRRKKSSSTLQQA